MKMDMLPVIISVVFLIPVSVGCLLVQRCRTRRSLRTLRIGLVVGYVALGFLVVFFSVMVS